MSWLSKGVKSVTNVVKDPKKLGGFLANPIGYLSLDQGLKAVGKGGIDGLFEPGAGPANPFNPADKSRLFDLRGLDYLKDNSAFKFDPSQFNFLKDSDSNPYTSALPDAYKSFADTYDAPTRTSDAMFNDYLGRIDAPSSVDEVQRGVDSDLMRQILEGVDVDTKNSIGSLKSDFADRGLGGPGMLSDIEANALTQAYSTGDKTKASARTDFATKELARLKAKEDAANEAYKTRYGVGVGFDTQAADIASRGATTDVTNRASLLGTQAQLQGADLDRAQRGELSFADILSKGDQSSKDAKLSRDALFAQLLNARDLGAYNLMSADYNAGADRELRGKEPSLFDKIIGNIGISL